ncbi:SWIM zinc finger family protein [Wolffia australiana]
MEIKDPIVDIPVQDPPDEIFSAADLTWTKFGSSEHHIDDVALIPFSRLDAFIVGESSNVECPTRFHIERGRKRSKGSLKEWKSDDYLLYRLYWCSFGPENYGEGGTILPSRRYRLNTRNRAARPQSMRGCTCHFAVKRLYARPSVAMLIYHERRHINKSGFVCHGPLDKDAIGPGAKRITYVGNELQQQTMSLIYLGIPAENVLQTHIEGIQRYCGPSDSIDASQYVQKLEMIIKRSTHELDLDDQASIRMWLERNKKSVFFFQDSTESDPFILGIQTEWQLQQMIRFGHHSILASHSSFGVTKLKYPLYSLLAFDSRHHALPVAWVITRTMAKPDVFKWMKELADRVHSADPGWRISGFIIDDAALEVDPIRQIFCCPVLFGLWRVRREWQRNIVKRCSNHEVRREMFRRLGEILYSVWSEDGHTVVLGEFLHDFVDQTAFLQYFKECWVPKLGMWVAAMRELPVASQEASCAAEAYHLRLKSKLYDDPHLGSLQRVDWLVHKLTTELHSAHWLDIYADETASFPAIKHSYLSASSWHRAQLIPDRHVALHVDNLPAARVASRTVWNPGPEFSLCDCDWAHQGNLCKHAVKASLLGPSPSLARLSFEKVVRELWASPAQDDSVELDEAVAWASQVLDRVRAMAELAGSATVGGVVQRLPLKWESKRGRTSVARPPLRNKLDLLPPKKKPRKRKRLSSIFALQLN